MLRLLRGYHQCCHKKIIAIIVDKLQGFFLPKQEMQLGSRCKMQIDAQQLPTKLVQGVKMSHSDLVKQVLSLK